MTTTMKEEAENGTQASGKNGTQTGKVYSMPPKVDINTEIAKYNSLGQYILSKLKGVQADATLMTDFDSGRKWTGRQLYEKIMNVATGLVDRYNFKPRTSVCISYDNTDRTHILALGVICAGGTVACSYPKDPYAELLYLSRKIEPSYLFCRSKHREKWSQQLSKDLGYKVKGISMDESDEIGDNITTLMNHDHTKSSAAVPPKFKNLKKEVAVVTMSSGTTGKPKAVPVTHWNCIAELVDSFISGGASKSGDVIKRRSNFACCASLDYVSGRLILFGALVSGFNAVILDGFDPESYARAIQEFKIKVIFIGAASFYNFMTYPCLEKYDISSIESIFPMGAKIVYLDELAKFLKRYPNIKNVRQGYGASETGGVAINRMEPEQYLRDAQNCGNLHSGVSVKIVEQESGKVCGPNEVGMVHVKSDTVFPGYYDKGLKRKNKQANGEENDDEDNDYFVHDSTVFDKDGFYISGDLGYFNDKEQLFILGRQKEVMSCRGAKKVLPQELEEIFDKHPAVEQVCVLGVQNKKLLVQHCPRAFIVPSKEYLERHELIASLDEIAPKDGVVVEDEATAAAREAAVEENLVHEGNANSHLCSLPAEWRRKLAEHFSRYINARIGWEKQITGGIVLLDKIPTSRATGKFDKNYLRALTLDQMEIYGDQSK